MRVLAVADKESAYYYDFYTPGKLSEFDLILACGDLRREYLEFLATLARCPVVYVRGNHNDSFLDSPPEGCICAEDRIVVCGGVRILGLGGSHRYQNGRNMYTEGQMSRRIRKMQFQLWKTRGSIFCSPTPPPGTSTTLTPSLTRDFSASWGFWTGTSPSTSSTATSTEITGSTFPSGRCGGRPTSSTPTTTANLTTDEMTCKKYPGCGGPPKPGCSLFSWSSAVYTCWIKRRKAACPSGVRL